MRQRFAPANYNEMMSKQINTVQPAAGEPPSQVFGRMQLHNARATVSSERTAALRARCRANSLPTVNGCSAVHVESQNAAVRGMQCNWCRSKGRFEVGSTLTCCASTCSDLPVFGCGFIVNSTSKKFTQGQEVVDGAGHWRRPHRRRRRTASGTRGADRDSDCVQWPRSGGERQAVRTDHALGAPSVTAGAANAFAAGA